MLLENVRGMFVSLVQDRHKTARQKPSIRSPLLDKIPVKTYCVERKTLPIVLPIRFPC